MPEHSEIEKSPWFSVWSHPKAAIRTVVNTNPRRSFYWLAFIYGLQILLYTANQQSLGYIAHYLVVLLFSLLLAPFVGSILLFISSWVLYFTGRWLKGKAPFSHVKAVMAWSKVPFVLLELLRRSPQIARPN